MKLPHPRYLTHVEDLWIRQLAPSIDWIRHHGAPDYEMRLSPETAADWPEAQTTIDALLTYSIERITTHAAQVGPHYRLMAELANNINQLSQNHNHASLKTLAESGMAEAIKLRQDLSLHRDQWTQNLAEAEQIYEAASQLCARLAARLPELQDWSQQWQRRLKSANASLMTAFENAVHLSPKEDVVSLTHHQQRLIIADDLQTLRNVERIISNDGSQEYWLADHYIRQLMVHWQRLQQDNRQGMEDTDQLVNTILTELLQTGQRNLKQIEEWQTQDCPEPLEAIAPALRERWSSPQDHREHNLLFQSLNSSVEREMLSAISLYDTLMSEAPVLSDAAYRRLAEQAASPLPLTEDEALPANVWQAFVERLPQPLADWPEHFAPFIGLQPGGQKALSQPGLSSYYAGGVMPAILLPWGQADQPPTLRDLHQFCTSFAEWLIVGMHFDTSRDLGNVHYQPIATEILATLLRQEMTAAMQTAGCDEKLISAWQATQQLVEYERFQSASYWLLREEQLESWAQTGGNVENLRAILQQTPPFGDQEEQIQPLAHSAFLTGKIDHYKPFQQLVGQWLGQYLGAHLQHGMPANAEEGELDTMSYLFFRGDSRDIKHWFSPSMLAGEAGSLPQSQHLLQALTSGLSQFQGWVQQQQRDQSVLDSSVQQQQSPAIDNPNSAPL